MKRKIYLISLILFCTISAGFSRDYSKLKSTRLIERTDYIKAEKDVKDCCKYLLSTPIKKNEENRNAAIQFLYRWMEGTPDFTFEIDENLAVLNNANQALIGVYLSAMTQYVLANKGKDIAKDKSKIKEYTVNKVIEYCENPKNGVEMNVVLKKWIQENKEDGPMQTI